MAERRAALQHVSAPATGTAEPGVRLAEIAHAGKLVLRGRPEPAVIEAAASVGLSLPTEPCTAAPTDSGTALWLGPDEWLVVTAPGAEGALAGALKQALAGLPAAVVDVTDSRTTIGVSGAAAREVLAKGCALDFHPQGFAAGAVKQSRLAMVDVIIHRPAGARDGADPAFEVTVLRSFADYLWQWLVDAATEYGVSATGAPD